MWLVAIPVLMFTTKWILVDISTGVRLHYLGIWVSAILLPIAGLAFIVYANIFAVRTAIRFAEQQL